MSLLGLAFRNLRRRRTRTILTILGVTIAVSFTVGLLSLTEGFMTSIDRGLARRGEDILIVPKGAENIPFYPMGSSGLTLPLAGTEKIKGLEEVKLVYPVFQAPFPFIFKGNIAFPLEVNGVPPSFFADLRPHLKASKGRLLGEGDSAALVAGASLARMAGWELGDKVELGGKEFILTGILEAVNTMEDLLAYAPIDYLQEVFAGQGKATYLAVTVKDVAQVDKTVQEINNLQLQASALSRKEMVGQMKEFLQTAQGIHFSVTLIAILIGNLFVFSTMMMAVSERTREIGTLRALGMARRRVFRLILSESFLIGIIAGGLGLLGGFLLSRLISFIVSTAFTSGLIHAAITPRLLGLGLLVALLTGTISGLYPAWRTSRLNIVEALRYE